MNVLTILNTILLPYFITLVITFMHDIYNCMGDCLWWRSGATSRTVPGSNPGRVTDFSVTYFLPTQPLVKMSTRDAPGGKRRPVR
jgi:hypothetical protein